MRRRGRVYRYCSKCEVEIKARTCKRCGQRSDRWGYIVDKAPYGAPRRQARRHGFKSEAEALSAMQALLAELGLGDYVEPTKMTTGQYLDAWLAGGCNGVDIDTLHGYRHAVKHARRHLGDIPLQSLTRVHLKGMYGKLRRDGARLDGRSGGLAERTIGKIHIALSSAFSQAVVDKVLKVNPAAVPPGSRKAGQLVASPPSRSRRPTWTEAEQQQYLDSVVTDPDHALYRLECATGMRMSELLGLPWADLENVLDRPGDADQDTEDRDDADRDTAVVHVRQEWSEEDAKLALTTGERVFSDVKTENGIRDIEIDAETARVLREHRQGQMFVRNAWGDSYQDHYLVFAQPDGRPYDHDALRKRFSRRVKAAGVRRIAFHDIRHTHATLLREAGVDIEVISRRLGHASIAQTLKLYGHVTPRLRRTAATAVSTILDGPAAASPNVRKSSLIETTAGPALGS